VPLPTPPRILDWTREPPGYPGLPNPGQDPVLARPPPKCYRPQNAAWPALLGGLCVSVSVFLTVAFSPKPIPALYSTASLPSVALSKHVYL
jgi:hypothetical protein